MSAMTNRPKSNLTYQQLSAILKAEKVSNIELAEALGVSDVHVSNMLNGKKSITKAVQSKIYLYLHNKTG
jgi:plasmid maintenance system antidote protein VapI